MKRGRKPLVMGVCARCGDCRPGYTVPLSRDLQAHLCFGCDKTKSNPPQWRVIFLPCKEPTT